MRQDVMIRGFKISCEVFGTGNRVVFCAHGFAGRPKEFRRLAQELTPDFRVIVPDLKPFHLSGDLIPFRHQVDLISDLIDLTCPREEQEQRPSFVGLIGSSFGAALLRSLLNLRPDDFDGLVLVNPMPEDPLRSLHNPELLRLIELTADAQKMTTYFDDLENRKNLEDLARQFRLRIPSSAKLWSDRRSQNLMIQAIRRFVETAQTLDLNPPEPTESETSQVLMSSEKDEIFKHIVHGDSLFKICRLEGAVHMAVHSNFKDIARELRGLANEAYPLQRKASLGQAEEGEKRVG